MKERIRAERSWGTPGTLSVFISGAHGGSGGEFLPSVALSFPVRGSQGVTTFSATDFERGKVSQQVRWPTEAFGEATLQLVLFGNAARGTTRQRATPLAMVKALKASYARMNAFARGVVYGLFLAGCTLLVLSLFPSSFVSPNGLSATQARSDARI